MNEKEKNPPFFCQILQLEVGASYEARVDERVKKRAHG